MNRSDLIRQVKEASGLTAEEADLMVRSFFEALANGLAREGRIELRGFGVFRVNKRNQAGFFNPKDGNYYGAVPVKTIKFKPSFEVAVNED